MLNIMIRPFILDDLPKPCFIVGYRPGKTGDFGRWLSLLTKRSRYFNHWLKCTFIHLFQVSFGKSKLMVYTTLTEYGLYFSPLF